MSVCVYVCVQNVCFLYVCTHTVVLVNAATLCRGMLVSQNTMEWVSPSLFTLFVMGSPLTVVVFVVVLCYLPH